MYIIAEIGINHNGSVDIAKKLIDVAVDAGCDAVKFQKRTIDLVYTRKELSAPRESPWGNTFGDQKRGLEFGDSEFNEINDYCRAKKIAWSASGWDVESINFISKFDVPFIKVPSALILSKELADSILKAKIPVMLSTGMSSVKEIAQAVQLYNNHINTIMHCTSTYPTAPDEMNLSVLTRMVNEHVIYDGVNLCQFAGSTRVGFSNHYSGIVWAPIVTALGAKVVEFHITLDRTMYGSDQAASIEPQGVRSIVRNIQLAEQMLSDGKKCVYQSELPIRDKLRK